MIKIKSSYHGFSLAFRVADSLGKNYVPGNNIQNIMLHSIKNLVHTEQLGQALGRCGINGKLHIQGGK